MSVKPDATTFTRIIQISRIRFWIYLSGPFLLGIVAGGSIHELFSLKSIVNFLWFLIPANVIIYGMNDLYDADTDAINRKKDSYEGRIHDYDVSTVRVLILSAFISTIPVFLLGNIRSNFIIALFLLLGICYSVPPIRFKSRAFLDFMSNVLYVLPGYAVYFLTGGISISFYILVGTMFWAWGMHLFSAIVDIFPDQKAGLTTSAVLFGKQKSLIITGVFWAIASISALSISPKLFFGFIYPFIIVAAYTIRTIKIHTLYKFFPYINTCIGFLLFLFILQMKM